jgi:GT2 family glycosyltransferase
MSSPPLVSIVMPFRDAAETLGECLDSITGQTLGDWELVAVDDRSVDSGPAIVAELAARDPRVRLVRAAEHGLVAALNHGVAASRAPLVARMDADDVMHPERLAEQVAYLDAHPDVDVAGCRVELFPDELVLAGYREYVRWQNLCVTPDDIAAAIYVESPLAHPSVVMRRDALLAVGGYRDGAFPEDYELWLRMHAAGRRMAKVPRVLLRWRESAARMSRVDPRYAREAFDLLRAQYLAKDGRLGSGRDLVIWGAGRRTRKRAERLISLGVSPVAWIDIDPDKTGRIVRDIPVHPREWLDRSPRPFVLLYLTAHGARDDAASWLSAHGYERGKDWLGVG